MKLAGIDMSLVSPGLCIIDTTAKHARFYAVRQRKSDVEYGFGCASALSAHYSGYVFEVFTTRPSDLGAGACRLARYDAVVRWILSVVASERCDRVAIENYAFGAMGTRAKTQLFELGGIVRYTLFAHRISVAEISPSAVKKRFAGKGQATKDEMYAAYVRLGAPCLYQLFGLSPTKYKRLPKPLDDVTDAFAIAHLLRDIPPST